MSVPKLTVIVDTSILLHYKQLDQINWPTEVDAADVHLMIVPVVIRELNKHKDQNPSKKLRKRAAEYLKWFNSLMDKCLETTIRSHTVLRFEGHEPSVNFESHNLYRDCQDDFVIAHVIEWAEKRPEDPILILTADTGLRVKAGTRNLPIRFWMDNEHKLPAEPDPDKERIKELERERREHRNRIPVLRLHFEDGKQHKSFTLFEITPAKIKAIVDDIWLHNSHHRLLSFDHDAVRDYCDEYENFLRALSYYWAHVVKLDLVLANDGTCVAEDIDVRLQFPPSLTLKSDFEIPMEPEAPAVTPWKPVPTDVLGPFPGRPSQHPQPNIIGPSVDTDSGVVKYDVESAKHKRRVALPPVFVIFEEPEQASSFAVKYTLLAANTLDEVEGELSVVIASKDTEPV